MTASSYEVSWTIFKALAVTKQLGIQYIENTSDYLVVVNEGVLVWHCTLPKDGSSDVTDFETSYKASCNKPSFFLGQFRNKYLNITGNATSVVKSGNGVIRGISINNNNTGGDVYIYDNTAGSGTKIAQYQLGTPGGGLLSTTGLNGPTYISMTAEFTTGLTVVTTGSSSNDITIYYV
jgi:hypothetical protein